MKSKDKNAFLDVLWGHYNQAGRDLAWRKPERDGSFDAYKILVSEFMLQQTQVARVQPKFNQFIEVFPAIEDLARAPRADVLRLWSGLGYNRRAVYLQEAARRLVALRQPWTIEQLVSCKGIGENTAAAIAVYSYNEPHCFIETNVRSVFIYHFFSKQDTVDDKDIRRLLLSVIDTENPREFYWALMDYGTALKATGNRSARKSKQHTKQSAFVGSRRQLRGEIVRYLSENGTTSREVIMQKYGTDERLPDVLRALEGDRILTSKQGYLSL